MKHNFLAFGFIALLTALYPIIIYYGLNQYGPRVLALVLLVILLIRAFFWKAFTTNEKAFYLVLVGGLCILAALYQSQEMLRYYPVLMNFGVAMFFLTSLWSQKPLIERFASIIDKDLSLHAKRYMRSLTLVWALLLMANGFIAWFTACCLPLEQWALYNGLIAYIIFGIFSVGELVVRHFYKKHYQE